MKNKVKFISAVGQKGGIGKTTVNLFIANELFYNLNYKVLYVDCDYQQSAKNKRISEFNDIGDKNVYEIIYLNISDSKTHEYLEKIKTKNEYDFVILDLPGRSDDDSIVNLLSLLDIALIPLVPEELASESTIDFIKIFSNIINMKKKHLGSDLKASIFLSRYKSNYSSHKDFSSQIKDLNFDNENIIILKDSENEICIIKELSDFSTKLSTYNSMSNENLNLTSFDNYDKSMSVILEYIIKS